MTNSNESSNFPNHKIFQSLRSWKAEDQTVSKENKMAVSDQVKFELDEAQRHLRDALAFAARSESAFIVNQIGEMIFNVEHMQELNDILTDIDA
tara:strand:- start:578 stop:859 length:282 start_codon:yes stop_codon:yes gene_type:complete